MVTYRWLHRTAVVALLTLALPSTVSAQGWLADRSRTQGPGFRVGDFEFHPGIGVELGWDSNIYYTSDDATTTVLRDSGILRATAHLLLSTRGQQRRTEGESGGNGTDDPSESQPAVSFQGGVSGGFYYFFNDDSRTNMELDANLALQILPGRVFSLQVTENFGRSIRPFTELTTPVSYARITNDAGVQASFQTTGGVLKVDVGYNFILNYFEDQPFQYGNRFTHNLTLRETFRFLPQTAIVHDTVVGINDYFEDGLITGGSALVQDSVTIRTRLGLNGAFTNEFSVLASVGYGAGFFNSGLASYDMEYESLIAQIQARWQIASNTSLTFGYDRDFQPSFVGNFYRRDRGSASFQTLVEGVFLIGVSANVGYYEFGAIVEPDGMTPVGTTVGRGDIRIVGNLFAEYRFTDWLGVNGTFIYTGNITDYQYIVDDMMTSFLDPAGYNKFELWLGVRVFY